MQRFLPRGSTEGSNDIRLYTSVGGTWWGLFWSDAFQ